MPFFFQNDTILQSQFCNLVFFSCFLALFLCISIICSTFAAKFRFWEDIIINKQL